jgi:hypothetical protein
MNKNLSFSRIRATGVTSLDLEPFGGFGGLMNSPGWDYIREQLVDQIYMEVAVHIRFQLKSEIKY